MTTISRLSAQPVYVPVTLLSDEDLQPVDLVGAAVRMAIVTEQPVTADWNTASIAGSFTASDGMTYYIVSYTVAAEAHPAGTHQAWVEVTYGGNVYVLRAGPIHFY